MDARPGPFRQRRGPADCLDGDDGGARAKCASGSMRPAARMRASRRAMIVAVSACSEMRLPVGATTSNASSMAPVDGVGSRPNVSPI